MNMHIYPSVAINHLLHFTLTPTVQRPTFKTYLELKFIITWVPKNGSNFLLNSQRVARVSNNYVCMIVSINMLKKSHREGVKAIKPSLVREPGLWASKRILKRNLNLFTFCEQGQASLTAVLPRH